MDNDDMHPSLSRLLEFARRKTADAALPVTDAKTLRAALDVPSAVMTNWKARGISKAGAIAAEAAFGCSVNWVLEGEGEESSGAPVRRERRAHALDATEALLVLGEAIQGMGDPGARQAAVGMLRNYIDNPEANHDMVDLIARRLAGEIPAVEQARRTGTR